MRKTALITSMAAGVALTAAAGVAAPQSAPAGASGARMTVTTYEAKPATIRLGAGPRCAALPYKLGARARDVDVKVADSRGREVWEAERSPASAAPGVVYRFTWCGQARRGGTVAPGSYLWLVEAEQTGTQVESRSYVRRIAVRR